MGSAYGLCSTPDLILRVLCRVQAGEETAAARALVRESPRPPHVNPRGPGNSFRAPEDMNHMAYSVFEIAMETPPGA